MDNNEFSFKALFNNSDFVRYESVKSREAVRNFCDYVSQNIKNPDIADEIQDFANDCSCADFEAAFEQGFCFAVKALKFMLKI